MFVQLNATSRYACGYPIGYHITPGCWPWVGARTTAGYGLYRHPVGRRVYRAHRWVYEQLAGKIPAGYQCHHRCKNKLCVNPAHIELVTASEHQLRHPGRSGRQGEYQESKTHCPQGHPYSGVNLYLKPKGGRECRICRVVSAKKATIIRRARRHDSR